MARRNNNNKQTNENKLQSLPFNETFNNIAQNESEITFDPETGELKIIAKNETNQIQEKNETIVITQIARDGFAYNKITTKIKI